MNHPCLPSPARVCRSLAAGDSAAISYRLTVSGLWTLGSCDKMACCLLFSSKHHYLCTPSTCLHVAEARKTVHGPENSGWGESPGRRCVCDAAGLPSALHFLSLHFLPAGRVIDRATENDQSGHPLAIGLGKGLAGRGRSNCALASLCPDLLLRKARPHCGYRLTAVKGVLPLCPGKP